MHTIHALNVNEALPLALQIIRSDAAHIPSRNGPVLEVRGPVATQYHRPWQMVLFEPARDANPFFHLFEAMWMLAGRNDLEYPRMFVKNMSNYSDDGVVLNGAYGERWRYRFGHDNINRVIYDLRRDPWTRRAYLPIWDGNKDGHFDTKDIPCNIGVSYQNRGGYLRQTVFNRSNDMLWGAYGSNVVTFGFLQQYIAECIGASIGSYYQISDSFHVYVDTKTWQNCKDLSGVSLSDYYTYGTVFPEMMPFACHVKPEDKNEFLREKLNSFVSDCIKYRGSLSEDFPEYGVNILDRICIPMFKAWYFRDSKYIEKEMKLEGDLTATYDWFKAGQEWLERRYKK